VLVPIPGQASPGLSERNPTSGAQTPGGMQKWIDADVEDVRDRTDFVPLPTNPTQRWVAKYKGAPLDNPKTREEQWRKLSIFSLIKR
jgi:hypothetical protein